MLRSLVPGPCSRGRGRSSRGGGEPQASGGGKVSAAQAPLLRAMQHKLAAAVAKPPARLPTTQNHPPLPPLRLPPHLQPGVLQRLQRGGALRGVAVQQ